MQGHELSRQVLLGLNCRVLPPKAWIAWASLRHNCRVLSVRAWIVWVSTIRA